MHSNIKDSYALLYCLAIALHINMQLYVVGDVCLSLHLLNVEVETPAILSKCLISSGSA